MFEFSTSNSNKRISSTYALSHNFYTFSTLLVTAENRISTKMEALFASIKNQTVFWWVLIGLFQCCVLLLCALTFSRVTLYESRLLLLIARISPASIHTHVQIVESVLAQLELSESNWMNARFSAYLSIDIRKPDSFPTSTASTIVSLPSRINPRKHTPSSVFNFTSTHVVLTGVNHSRKQSVPSQYLSSPSNPATTINSARNLDKNLVMTSPSSATSFHQLYNPNSAKRSTAIVAATTTATLAKANIP